MRSLPKGPLTFGLAAIFMVAAGVVMLHSLGVKGPFAEKNPYGKALERDARDAFRESPQVDATIPEQVTAAVVAAEAWGEPIESPEERRLLAATMSEFFAAMGAGDGESYANWMKSQGYHADENRLEDVPTDESAYRQRFGADWPPRDELTAESYFLNSVRHIRQNYGEMTVPKRLATGPHGFLLYEYWSDDPRGVHDVPPYLIEDDPHWIGSRSISPRRMWLPGATYDDILARDGKVLCSVMIIGVQSRTGIWFNLDLKWFYDPQRTQWWLAHLSYGNTYEVNHPPMW